MSTLLATFADSEVKVRFKEPFLTEGINRTGAAVMAPGIYRGFKLIANVTNNLLTVEDDPTIGDHVLVFETDDGYSIHIRKTSDFTIDFTGLSVSTEYIIAVYAVYGLNVTTAAYIRAYTQAEYDVAPEKEQLVILGTGTTPGSMPGLITPSANKRTSAWYEIAPENREGKQLIDNGGFELADVGAITFGGDAEPVPGWDTQKGYANNVTMSIDQTAPLSGANELKMLLSGSATQSLQLQYGSVFSVYSGQVVRASVWIRGDSITSISDDRVGLDITFWDQDLNFVSGGFTASNVGPISGTFAYTELTKSKEVPATAAYMHAALIFYENNSTTGTIWFDDASVWLGENRTALDDVATADLGEASTRTFSLDLLNPDSFSSVAGFLSEMVQLRSLGLSGGIVELMMKARDGVTPFNLGLKNGALEFLDKISTAADAAVPRIVTPAADYTVADYTLFWESQDAGGDRGAIRIYVGQGTAQVNGASLVLTHNAAWDGTQWDKDEAADPAGMYVISDAGFRTFFYLSGGSAPWADADWRDDVDGFEQLRYAWGSTGHNNRGDLRVFGSIEDLGEGMLDATYAAVARIHANFPDGATVKYTCLLKLDNGAGEGDVRLYVSDGFIGALNGNATQFVLTVNARWTGSAENWTYDDNTRAACRVSVSSIGIFFHSKSGTVTDPWTDAEWEDDAEGFRLLKFLRSVAGRSELDLDGGLSLLMPPVANQSESFLDTSARIYAETGDASLSALTLMRHYESASVSGPEWREYVKTTATGLDIYKTWNARYDDNGGTPQWFSDDSAQPSSMIHMDENGDWEISQKTATASAWTSWDGTPYSINPNVSTAEVYVENGRIHFSPSGSFTNPAKTSVPDANAIMGINTVKAWGHITTGSTPTLNDAFNASTPTYVGNLVQVTFRAVMDAAGSGQYYAVALGVEGGVRKSLTLANLANTGFQVELFDSSGTSVNLSTNAHNITFIVLARQTTT